jgi:type III pantothenate kinase
MIIVIDVGNTNTVIGVMDGREVMTTLRITTLDRSTDEFGLLLSQLFEQRGVNTETFTGGICASVVPSMLYSVDKAMRRYFNVDVLIVGRKLKTGIRVRTDNPREVGSDRIVNAVAAKRLFGTPVVVVDFGTATTLDCVDTAGDYVGGVIAPGFRISEEALFSRTAQLPRVELNKPPSAIGKNTVHAMQSGLLYGYVGLVDGLAKRCCEELGPDCKVVATGGLSNLVAAESACIQHVEPHLTLLGLAWLYELNSSLPGE